MRRRVFKIIRIVWVCAGVCSLIWLNYSFLAKGVDRAVLTSDAQIAVTETEQYIRFIPEKPLHPVGLVFFPGGGVEPTAYAPLVRGVAEKGYPAVIIKLPYRFAPLASHRQEAIGRARQFEAERSDIQKWVIAGHSKGGAIASELTRFTPELADGLVLIGTSYPKDWSMAASKIPVKKILATNDGVAKEPLLESTRHNLPQQTKWVRIVGGNHSQFGYYGPQFGDSPATISRAEQQRQTLQEIVATLDEVRKSP